MAFTNISGISSSGLTGLASGPAAAPALPARFNNLTPTTLPNSGPPAATAIEANKMKKITGNLNPLVFPGDLTSSDYFIVFNSFTYSNDRPEEARRTFAFDKAICLPLPASISDDYNSNYNESNLYFAGNAAREGLTSFFNQNGVIGGLDKASNADFAGQKATEIINSLNKQNVLNAAAATAVMGVEGLAGVSGVGAAIKSSLQLSSNPYPVMIFQGSGLKPPVTFSWTLYPESHSESMSLKKIVNYLRREMLPEAITNNPAILKTPAVFEIKMSPSENTRKFKRCVITNLNVNYTPNGLSFLAGKGGDDPHPAAVTLSVTFKEIEVWLANDYYSTEELQFSQTDTFA